MSLSSLRGRIGWGCLVLAAAASVARGGDILDEIRSDVPGVIVLRNLEGTIGAVNELGAQAGGRWTKAKIAPFEQSFMLEPGTCDYSKPMVVVLTRCNFDPLSMVLVFHPRDPKSLLEKIGGQENVPVARPGLAGEECRIMMRRGVAFVSERERPLRLFRRPVGKRSYGSWLDAEEKKMVSESDVFVSLRLGRWREQIAPFVALTTQMMKLAMSAQQRPEQSESMRVMFDWVANGAAQLVNDMDGVSVAARIGFDRIELAHHHRFIPDSRTSEYLGKVKPSRKDVLSKIPDQPFIVLGITNWNIPGEDSLSVRLCRSLFSGEELSAEVPEAKREGLLENLTVCYDQILASYFVFGPAAQGGCPFQLMGGYVMRDARKGLKQFHYIHEHGSELLASMIPGVGCPGPFVTTKSDGTELYRLQLESPGMNEKMRRHFAIMYGKGAQLEQAVIDKDQMIYSIGRHPGGISRYIQQQSRSKSIRNDARVSRLMNLLPKDTQAVVLFDFRRMAEALPEFMRMSREFARGRKGAPHPQVNIHVNLKGCDEQGPLIGWAGVVSERTITGRLVMERDGVGPLLRIARGIYPAHVDEDEEGAGENLPPVPEQPREP